MFLCVLELRKFAFTPAAGCWFEMALVTVHGNGLESDKAVDVLAVVNVSCEWLLDCVV